MVQHMNSRFDYLDRAPKPSNRKIAAYVALGAVASVLAGTVAAAATTSAVAAGTTAASAGTALANPM